MKRKYQKTLNQIYARPTSGNILWTDIEALFKALGATVSERAGSRVAIVLFAKLGSFTDHTRLQTPIKGQLPVFESGYNSMR